MDFSRRNTSRIGRKGGKREEMKKAALGGLKSELKVIN